MMLYHDLNYMLKTIKGISHSLLSHLSVPAWLDPGLDAKLTFIFRTGAHPLVTHWKDC